MIDTLIIVLIVYAFLPSRKEVRKVREVKEMKFYKKIQDKTYLCDEYYEVCEN